MQIHFLRNRRVLAVGLSGALVLGLVGAGVAYAEGPGAGGDAPAVQDAGRHRPRALKAAMRELVKASGLSQEVVAQGVKDGKTFREILTENGKDPSAVQAQALADVKTRLDKAVADGKMTQAQADKLLARADTGFTKLMDATPRHRDDGNGRGRLNQIRKQGIQVAATTIGITPQELAKDLRDGQTVAQVATAHGVSPQAVIDAMVAKANARIDQAVANGKLTQAQGDKLKERASAVITKFVNEGGLRHQDGGNAQP